MPNQLHRRCNRLATVATAAAMLLFAATAPAQSAAPIREYINSTWDTLTRSSTECKSLVDPKVTTEPVLYLPADIATPPEISTLKQKCKVDVRRLPRVIHSEGDVRPEDLKTPGLLYLPHPYVVPGGRFNEQYGWDSYFIVLGLISDGRLELARGMVDNFLFEIEHYGALLNANRTYYLTRSQPPLLGEMIREVHAEYARQAAQNTGEGHQFDPDKPSIHGDNTWLNHAYVTAKRDYALWRTSDHKAGDTGLARYYDIGDGPVIEMADDSTYYPDAIRWMLAHPAAGKQYLVSASAGDKTSCDMAQSKVCAAAEVNGMRLTRDFYKGDRAMRESGYDTSFRFGAFSGSTHHFVPVCLNSLLYRYETDMATFAAELGRTDEAVTWSGYAAARKAAMNTYLWDEARGGFYDYDFITKRRSDYTYASALYPTWAGLASARQVSLLATKILPKLLQPHGLAMSDRATGMQWDQPYLWAPAVYFAAEGLSSAARVADAQAISRRYVATVEENFAREGTLREKYDAVTGGTDTPLVAGYRSNNAGFGWTNGVYLRLLKVVSHEVRPNPKNDRMPQLQSTGNAYQQTASKLLQRNRTKDLPDRCNLYSSSSLRCFVWRAR